MKRLTVSFLLFLAMSCAALADLSGSYKCRVADGIMLVKLTQLKDKLSGFMQFVSFDSYHAEPAVNTYRLEGICAGKALSLQRKGAEYPYQGIEGKITSTGIEATMANPSGHVMSLSLKPTTDAAWNKLVDTYAAECNTRYYRLKWRGLISSWITDLDIQENNNRAILDSNSSNLVFTEKELDSTQKRIQDLETRMGTVKLAIESHEKDYAAKENKRKELVDRSREKWDSALQSELQALDQELSKQRDKLNSERSELVSMEHQLTSWNRTLEAHKQNLASWKQQIANNKDALDQVAQKRRHLRDIGLLRAVRKWQPGQVKRAKVISQAGVWQGYVDASQMLFELPVSSVVDVLPLDNGWTAIRIEDGQCGWVKSQYLKLL